MPKASAAEFCFCPKPPYHEKENILSRGRLSPILAIQGPAQVIAKMSSGDVYDSFETEEKTSWSKSTSKIDSTPFVLRLGQQF